MAITTCIVSGVITTVGGGGVVGATVKANAIRPTIYTDGTLILNSEISTTTDVDGNWNLTLAETETTSTSITISFYFPSGGQIYDRRDYTIVVPNAPTANFTDLIVGQ